MRFSENGFYIERYIKCDNCGMLIYGEGLARESDDGEPQLYCSDWCVEWARLRASGEEHPRLPLPKLGIHDKG